jgi:hypothetical protein
MIPPVTTLIPTDGGTDASPQLPGAVGGVDRPQVGEDDADDESRFEALTERVFPKEYVGALALP